MAAEFSKVIFENPQNMYESVSWSVVSDSLRLHGLYSPPVSSVHGISQTKILEWVAISFSRGSSRPSDQIWVSYIAGRFLTIWATCQCLNLRLSVHVVNPLFLL